jgi:hypothetical protein
MMFGEQDPGLLEGLADRSDAQRALDVVEGVPADGVLGPGRVGVAEIGRASCRERVS